MTRPRAETVADEIIAADTARAATVSRAGKRASGVATDGGSGIPQWLIGLGALILAISLGGGIGFVLFGGGQVVATPTAAAVAPATQTEGPPIDTLAPPIETVVPIETIEPPPETAFACEAPAGISDYLASAISETRSADDLCQLFESVYEDDPLGDQFAQDGLRPGLAAPYNDIIGSYVVELKNRAGSSASDLRRQACGAATPGVQVLCGSVLPAADATATVSWVRLAAPQPAGALFSLGLNVRYDDPALGREATTDLPLLVTQDAHRLYTSPATTEGTFDPPAFSDFRTNSGAYSDHVQIIAADWFAFITFDDGTGYLPWICQFDTVGQGNEHQACDIPASAIAGEFEYVPPVQVDIFQPQP